MQSLFSVTAFKRYALHHLLLTHCFASNLFSSYVFLSSLLLVLLQRLAVDDSRLHERFPAWRELLSLAAEFELPLEHPVIAPVPRTVPVAAPAVLPAPEVTSVEDKETDMRLTRSMVSHAVTSAPVSKGQVDETRVEIATPPHNYPASVSRHVRSSPVAATSLMASLFQTFQRQMDGISGFTRDYTVAPDNRKNKKNGQQDAMEFLTYLLDTLHEEIIRAEAEIEAQLAAGAVSEEGIVRQDSLEMEIALTRQNSLSVDAQQVQSMCYLDSTLPISDHLLARILTILIRTMTKGGLQSVKEPSRHQVRVA